MRLVCVRLLLIWLYFTFANGLRRFEKCSNPEWIKTMQLQTRCWALQQTPLELLCSGTYNRDIYLKYHDDLAQIGSPYKIYGRREPSQIMHLLVIFHESPLMNCGNSVRMSQKLDFYCAKNKTAVALPKGQLYCQRFSVSYVDELLLQCLKPKMSSLFPVTGTTGIHYALPVLPNAAPLGMACNWNIVVLLVSITELLSL